jgi:hypothetical protein
MRALMAVRLDIRPRLVLRDEPTAKARRRWRLPPLTVPAVTYWLAMAALTYGFARLGESPIEPALASEPLPAEPFEAAPPPASPVSEPSPPPAEVAAPLAAPAAPTPELDSATEPPAAQASLASEPEPRPLAREEREAEPPVSTSAPPVATLPSEAPLARLDFPEFTDSSRTRAPERASDGPRIDGLFPRASERPETAPDRDQPAPSAPPKSDASAPVVGTSCEAAIARNNENYELGGPRGPADITRGAYASILENGRYLSGCSLPARSVLEICAAVKGGRAIGVTVSSNPPSAALNACVRSAVSRLRFPESPRLDVTRTRFDAAR